MGTGKTRLLLIGGIVLVAAAALVGAWALAFRDTATPASVDDAVARFREQAQAADLPIAPGVYVYATTGEESISALGGIRHRYPPQSTITVQGGGCGMIVRWDVLETRWNELEVCTDGSLGTWQESHQFVGQDDRSTWDCADAVWLPEDASVGAEQPYVCESADTRQEGTTTVVGEEVVPVMGHDVETLHIRLEAEETGESRGSLVEERWLEASSGLPVRITYEVRTANDSPIGDVIFEERYTLDLTSLEPRR